MDIIETIVGGALRAVLSWHGRSKLPKTDGQMRVAGLSAPVEVLRDRWGVPHIYAQDSRDLVFAQGFVHAQDRLWQMEFQRRLVAGRLAEVLGPLALPLDRCLRIIGMRRVADQEAAMLRAGGGAILAEWEAYAAGVNACMEAGSLPLEFTLLRYRPEPWTVTDSLSWIKMMAWSLSINWQTEIVRARLIDRLGAEAEAPLEPPYLDRWPSVLPSNGQSTTGDRGRSQITGNAYGEDRTGGRTPSSPHAEGRPPLGPLPGSGPGSNNWVIAGSRTASGAPLLANDMHLPLLLPCMWYENHLVCDNGADRDLNVTGVTLPGIPWVVSGHNGRVAWGYTAGFADVQDLYVEHLRKTQTGMEYEYEGNWLEATVLREEIRVKGAAGETQEVVITRHGPIVNDLAPDLAGKEPLALRWTSLEPDAMSQVFASMMAAGSCLEFREALRSWTGPVLSVVYADTTGNIGYSLAGKVPIRSRGDGRAPVPGWTGEYDWTGYIPFDEALQAYNPEAGYLVSANNRLTGGEYPYYLSGEYHMGDRAQRIVELIEAGGKIDPAYVRQMHFDWRSPTALAVARYLGQLHFDDPQLAKVARQMAEWDGMLAPESCEAAVYEVFARELLVLLLAPRLDELTPYYMGHGITWVLADHTLFGDRALEWLQTVLAAPDGSAGGATHGEGGGRDDAARKALRQTLDLLKKELGRDPANWAWGKLHQLTFGHPMGRVKPLNRVFSLGPYPLGGDGTTVWASGADHHDLETGTVNGPPFRFIADLNDLRHCLGLLAPGQSGQLGSPHYDDQVQDWFTGGYHPMLYERVDVEAALEGLLRLKPAE